MIISSSAWLAAIIGCSFCSTVAGLPTNSRVRQKLQPMITASQADELMIITAVYDHDARKRSYSLLADAFGLGNKAAA